MMGWLYRGVLPQRHVVSAGYWEEVGSWVGLEDLRTCVNITRQRCRGVGAWEAVQEARQSCEQAVHGPLSVVWPLSPLWWGLCS